MCQQKLMFIVSTKAFTFISGVEETEEKESFADGHVPTITWDPCFCVLLEDMGKLTFHGSEEVNSHKYLYRVFMLSVLYFRCN